VHLWGILSLKPWENGPWPFARNKGHSTGPNMGGKKGLGEEKKKRDIHQGRSQNIRGTGSFGKIISTSGKTTRRLTGNAEIKGTGRGGKGSVQFKEKGEGSLKNR